MMPRGSAWAEASRRLPALSAQKRAPGTAFAWLILIYGQEDGRSGSTLTRLPLKEAEGLPGEMAELRQAVGAAGDDDLLRLPEIGL